MLVELASILFSHVRQAFARPMGPNTAGALTVDDKVIRRTDLLLVGEGVPHAAGVGFGGVGKVGSDDVEVARGNHVEFSV